MNRKKKINLYKDYTRMVYEGKYKSILGEGLKILTLKQILQRLPMPLGHVKAGNTSENLLNEIKIIYIHFVLSKRNY